MSRIRAIYERLQSVVPIRRRGANDRLYRALVAAMEITEACQADPAELEDLSVMLTELPPLPGRNRFYVEKGAHLTQRVARLVFYGDEHEANISRYAIAVRRAMEQGVRSPDFMEALTRGGVNRFYATRPLEAQTVKTRCLRLTEPIEHPKNREFTITLRRTPENAYEVVAFTIDEEPSVPQPRP